MGRGQKSTTAQKPISPRSLLFGQTIRKQGPVVSETSFIEAISDLYRGHKYLFARRGLKIIQTKEQRMSYHEEGEAVPPLYHPRLEIQFEDDQGNLMSMEHYLEPDETHVLSLLARANHGLLSRAEQKIITAFANLNDQPERVMFEFYINSRDKFENLWADKIKRGGLTLADHEMHYPLRSEAELCQEICLFSRIDDELLSLEEMIGHPNGYQALSEQAHRGLLYLRVPLASATEIASQ